MNKRLLGTACVMGALLHVGIARPADLFSAKTYQPLASDVRAAHVGDVLTILIVEEATASNTADTAAGANTSVQASVATPHAGSNALQLGLGDRYAGKGSIQRTERLVAQLGVTVRAVEDNGDLLVSGEQQIDVNGEKTRIKLSGRVRALDIAENNTLPSNRLADAKIDYVGDGYITDRSKPGLIPRLLGWLGLW
ncbi:flagellar basal body L-ring protein FlgH [Burkholderia ubonensis]|uniref:flagellar basal body L-ring protein FlgH n=1 Tax=Burkholderia ubonensis TaxID=101571 RepID=UPI0009B47898|nr:flagellar basal body L-ring protein FlgH [Burkholderia ubonensis]